MENQCFSSSYSCVFCFFQSFLSGGSVSGDRHGDIADHMTELRARGALRRKAAGEGANFVVAADIDDRALEDRIYRKAVDYRIDLAIVERAAIARKEIVDRCTICEIAFAHPVSLSGLSRGPSVPCPHGVATPINFNRACARPARAFIPSRYVLTSFPGRFSTLHPSFQYSSICASVSGDPRASLPCALHAAAIRCTAALKVGCSRSR